MISTHPQKWRAQTPPGGFVDRTVAAILRDRIARRSEGRSGRRIILAAVAAVLVAGGAWGWTILPKVRPPIPAESKSSPPRAFAVVAPAPAARPPPDAPADPP